jgi:hypothetical protein
MDPTKDSIKDPITYQNKDSDEIKENITTYTFNIRTNTITYSIKDNIIQISEKDYNFGTYILDDAITKLTGPCYILLDPSGYGSEYMAYKDDKQNISSVDHDKDSYDPDENGLGAAYKISEIENDMKYTKYKISFIRDITK